MGILSGLRSDPVGTLIVLLYQIPAILIALTLHELAHGYVAYRCGDPTAQMMGRLTFNPLKHLDPIGTLLMVLCGALVGGVCLALRILRGFDGAGFFESLAMCLAAGLLVPSITIPMAYKFGAEKGRYLVMFLIIGVMIGLMAISGEDFQMASIPVWLSPWMLLPAMLFVYAASWAVSAGIYERKEIS